MNPRRKRSEGATLIESCIVIILLCLILFGMLQLSIVTAANDIIAYAASCGARCAAVGYDDEMIEKSIRVAALPNMGPAPRMSIGREKQVAKAYLTQQNIGELRYAYSDTLDGASASLGTDLVEVNLIQDYPLAFPFARAFYSDGEIEMSPGEVQMFNHAALYLGN